MDTEKSNGLSPFEGYMNKRLQATRKLAEKIQGANIPEEIKANFAKLVEMDAQLAEDSKDSKKMQLFVAEAIGAGIAGGTIVWAGIEAMEGLKILVDNPEMADLIFQESDKMLIDIFISIKITLTDYLLHADNGREILNLAESVQREFAQSGAKEISVKWWHAFLNSELGQQLQKEFGPLARVIWRPTGAMVALLTESIILLPVEHIYIKRRKGDLNDNNN